MNHQFLPKKIRNVHLHWQNTVSTNWSKDFAQTLKMFIIKKHCPCPEFIFSNGISDHVEGSIDLTAQFFCWKSVNSEYKFISFFSLQFLERCFGKPDVKLLLEIGKKLFKII